MKVRLRAGMTMAFVLVTVAMARTQTPPPQTAPPPTTQTLPKPQPFPGAGGQQSAPAKPPASPSTPQTAPQEPAPTPPPAGTPTVQDLNGTPVYPGAEYVDSFDAGRGQRYYLYGTNTPYADIVSYYRNVLKNSANRELFRAPAMHQFDLGRYQEEAMAYPPSVVVKDYAWNESPGYLFVTGTTEKRFKTIIQIVPR